MLRHPTKSPIKYPAKQHPNKAAAEKIQRRPAPYQHIRQTQPQRPTLDCLTPIVVILPVHNEQGTITQTLQKVRQYLYRHPHVTCIFIDDGSTDRTRQILTQHIRNAKTPQLQMLTYSPQAGKGYAVRLGMQAAMPHCEYLCLLDGDLAYSLDHLDDLMIALQRSDIAIGNRQRAIPAVQQPPWFRQQLVNLVNRAAKRILNLPLEDPQAGLKGFRQHIAQQLFRQQRIEGFGFDYELLYLARKRGFGVAEVPAQVSEPHQHKVSQVKLVKDHLGMIKDVMQIRFNDWVGRYR